MATTKKNTRTIPPRSNGKAPDPPATPQAIESECALLGAILLDQSILPAVGLTPKHFYLDKHQWIYSAMLGLAESGGEIDLISLAAYLEQKKKLDAIGGTAYLSQLLTSVPTAAHFRTYAQAIRDAHYQRTVAEVAGELAGIAYQGRGTSTQDRLNLIDKQIARLRTTQETEQTTAAATWADLDGILAPIQWAWKGWIPYGQLTIEASEPGKGKSALALHIAKSFITGEDLPDGQPFTGELGFVLWVECEAAQAINLERARMWKLPIGLILTPFDDPLKDAQLDLPEHRQTIARRAHHDDVKFIVVDSLRGSHSGDEKDSGEMAAITKWLAELARDTNKPILLTHHYRKRGMFDGEGINLDRMRGSTAIAQFARVVWAISEPNPANVEYRRLEVIKSNLGKFPKPVGFEITEQGIRFGVAPEAPRQETTTDRATDLLLGLLLDGPKTADRIKSELEGAGISWPAANRAKEKLGIISVKPGGIWHWSLPAKELNA